MFRKYNIDWGVISIFVIRPRVVEKGGNVHNVDYICLTRLYTECICGLTALTRFHCIKQQLKYIWRGVNIPKVSKHLQLKNFQNILLLSSFCNLCQTIIVRLNRVNTYQIELYCPLPVRLSYAPSIVNDDINLAIGIFGG